MSNPEVMKGLAVTKQFRDGKQQLNVLSGVNISVKQGEMVAIVGASGSGKSTLLHILGGLETPTSGQVYFNGDELNAFNENQLADWRNQYLGFVYQFHHLLPEFNALENIAMPLFIAGVPRAQALKKAQDLLTLVGLAERGDHRPAELSGGERQRVAIARALVNDPALVLADEPTGNLDAKSAVSCYQLMRELNQRLGTAFLIVTHDQSLAQQLDRELRLSKGMMQDANVASEAPL